LNCSAQLFVFNPLPIHACIYIYVYVYMCLYIFVPLPIASGNLNLFDGHDEQCS